MDEQQQQAVNPEITPENTHPQGDQEPALPQEKAQTPEAPAEEATQEEAAV
ncbi:MAG: hypothetical protein KGJ89_05525 [Patescibacteria group bacterium]|nr:hypothetical protein [Patescibacteria group bacterium]MDE2227382.1 hypothetical protein [Patescibacteria group bacterium]